MPARKSTQYLFLPIFASINNDSPATEKDRINKGSLWVPVLSRWSLWSALTTMKNRIKPRSQWCLPKIPVLSKYKELNFSYVSPNSSILLVVTVNRHFCHEYYCLHGVTAIGIVTMDTVAVVTKDAVTIVTAVMDVLSEVPDHTVKSLWMRSSTEGISKASNSL